MYTSKIKSWSLSLLLIACMALAGCSTLSGGGGSVSLADIPDYAGQPYVVINENQPSFSDTDTTDSFEIYSELDGLGRCGVAYANICQELMPTQERGNIGSVKPTGWQSVQYDSVDGKHLYNRCHLIGFQLAGENANQKNLITGTRAMNVDGMLPFENMVADYVKETNNHVLYRVTPIFEENHLVADGVEMEAYSVEDNGEGVCFHVFCYNNQPGITIDYKTGKSSLSGASKEEGTAQAYILNINSKKFHNPSCSGATSMRAENKQTYEGSREALVAQGYSPCGICKP